MKGKTFFLNYAYKIFGLFTIKNNNLSSEDKKSFDSVNSAVLRKNTETIDYKKLVTEISGQDPSICYQCGKCSAGCPVRAYTETPPNRIIRYFQLGLYEKALKSETIWLCTGCMTCSSRCPKNFELSKFMDALREIAVKNNYKPKNTNAIKFHQSFLNQVKKYGRTFEFGMIRDYKLLTGKLFQDIDAAPAMFIKGKISIMPHKISDKDIIQKIFKDSSEQKVKAENISE